MRRWLLTVLLCFFASIGYAEDRHPFVAGSFYPSDPKELSAMVDGFMDAAPKNRANAPLALIVPHAGFIYSGKTAAYAYAELRGQDIDTVVLIGPYHRAMFEGASVWKKGVWRTPLGPVSVDEALAAAIAGEDPSFGFSESVHAAEHSLETQLPFLQKTLKDFKIVPILVSDPSPKNTSRLAKAVWKHLQGRKAVVIVSTDMSHYFTQDVAQKMDALAFQRLKQEDGQGLYGDLMDRKAEFCGHAAVLTLLEMLRLAGPTKLEVLHHATSADATGDTSRVVGYGAAVVRTGSGSAALTSEEQRTLLNLARQTVEAQVSGKPLPGVPRDGIFGEDRAVFVTIRENGALRGCIGRILAEEPLGEAVRHMAVQSATADPRFPPVTAKELPGLKYEVSVLSPPEKVADAGAVEMGKHGVLLSRGSRGGVFLPKVAEELAWDKEEFLGELCSQKAGLPRDCWKDPATELSVFTAQEFSEDG